MDTPIKPFVKLSQDMAVKLLHEFIRPGTPSLAGMFAWAQPSEDTTINLDGAHASIEEISLFDLLMCEQRSYTPPCDYIYKDDGTCEVIHNPNSGFKYWHELRLSLDTTKKIAREIKEKRGLTLKDIRDMGDTRRNKGYSVDFSGMILSGRMSIKYSELDTQEKLLYRLAVLGINGIGEDIHNWACDYLCEITSNHIKMNDDWQVEVNDMRGGLASDILDILDGTNDWQTFVSNHAFMEDNDYYFNADRVLSSSAKSMLAEWNEDINTEDVYIPNWEIQDKLLSDIFGEGITLQSWHKNDILPILAMSLDFLQTSWNEGYLTITTIPDDFTAELRNWLIMVNSQGILPGMEEL